MSTLSTANITSKAANTPPVIKDVNGTECGQFCRAWINFNGTGTVAIRDSFNVAALTDNNDGRYEITFTTAMSSANYCPVMFNNSTSTQHYESFDNQWGGGMTLATTTLKVSSYGNSAWADSAMFHVVVFGG